MNLTSQKTFHTALTLDVQDKRRKNAFSGVSDVVQQVFIINVCADDCVWMVCVLFVHDDVQKKQTEKQIKRELQLVSSNVHTKR